MIDRISYRISVLNKPVHEQYELVMQKDNSILLKHLLVRSSTDEFLLLKKTGCVLLPHFRRIEILPSLHERDVFFRKKILPGVKERKNPDFRIDGAYWELECPTFPYNYNKIVQRIRKGYNQANKIVLYFEKKVNGFTVRKAIEDRFILRREFNESIVIVGSKVVDKYKK